METSPRIITIGYVNSGQFLRPLGARQSKPHRIICEPGSIECILRTSFLSMARSNTTAVCFGNYTPLPQTKQTETKRRPTDQTEGAAHPALRVYLRASPAGIRTNPDQVEVRVACSGDRCMHRAPSPTGIQGRHRRPARAGRGQNCLSRIDPVSDHFSQSAATGRASALIGEKPGSAGAPAVIKPYAFRDSH